MQACPHQPRSSNNKESDRQPFIARWPTAVAVIHREFGHGMIVAEVRTGVEMSKNVEMGAAGSATVALLTLAVVFLLRSFYRRFTRMEKRKDDETQ